MQPACETGDVTVRKVTVRATAPVERLRRWRPGRPLDLGAGPRADAPGQRRPDASGTSPGVGIWRATRTPDGPATTRLPGAARRRRRRGAGLGAGRGLGAGGRCRTCSAPPTTPTGFEPGHPVLATAWRRHPGWRVPRSRPRPGGTACRPSSSRRSPAARPGGPCAPLVRQYGEPAPGPVDQLPGGLRVPPVAAHLGPRAVLGVAPGRRRPVPLPDRRDRRRLRRPARGARRRCRRPRRPTRLRSLPGIGVWTAAEVGQRALGDPDAVSVGDFHLVVAGRLGAGRARRSTTTRCSSCSSPTAGTATARCG